jgi:hypothetical protein
MYKRARAGELLGFNGTYGLTRNSALEADKWKHSLSRERIGRAAEIVVRIPV